MVYTKYTRYITGFQIYFIENQYFNLIVFYVLHVLLLQHYNIHQTKKTVRYYQAVFLKYGVYT